MHTDSFAREKTSPTHERLYRQLRGLVMHGEIRPGQPLTLRGLADLHGVSVTPVREAVRRLAAEGALHLTSTGRITTPVLGNDRIEELAALRSLLEPELASRAMPRVHAVLIERMTQLNEQIRAALRDGDAVAYVRLNFEFHRTLFLRAQAPAMLAMLETAWLQLGPTLCARSDRNRDLEVGESHDKVLATLSAGDEPGTRVALRADVFAGLRRLRA